jgi:hypothetical protein
VLSRNVPGDQAQSGALSLNGTDGNGMNLPISMKFLRQQFAQGRNIMSLLRQNEAASINTPAAILASYDLQAGSYAAAMSNEEHRAGMMSFTAAISRLADSLGLDSRPLRWRTL